MGQVRPLGPAVQASAACPLWGDTQLPGHHEGMSREERASASPPSTAQAWAPLPDVPALEHGAAAWLSPRGPPASAAESAMTLRRDGRRAGAVGHLSCHSPSAPRHTRARGGRRESEGSREKMGASPAALGSSLQGIRRSLPLPRLLSGGGGLTPDGGSARTSLICSLLSRALVTRVSP